ncbi:hypothetical protein HK102_007037, partial [Quaeritorhiza haematococci]
CTPYTGPNLLCSPLINYTIYLRPGLDIPTIESEGRSRGMDQLPLLKAAAPGCYEAILGWFCGTWYPECRGDG